MKPTGGVIRDTNASRLVGLTKSTEGTLTLSGTNTYTGATTLGGGTLVVNGKLAAGSAVSVGAATLAGSGVVAGVVTTSGAASRLTPGQNVGTLTLGALNASNGARFAFELGPSSDRLAVTGAFAGSAAAQGLAFDFADTGGLAPRTPYTLMTFGAASGLDSADLIVDTPPVGFVPDTSFGVGGNGFRINANSLEVQFVRRPRGTVVNLR